MKPINKTTSKSVGSYLRVITEDFNMRQKNFLKKETLRNLELVLPSLGNKKLSSRY